MACNPDGKSFLADQMKTMLDRARDHFPHVIGVTTNDDFHKMCQEHVGFVERFQKIAVEETTEEETLQILKTFLLKQAPEVLVEEGALELLVEKTKDGSPRSSLRVLAQCIQRASSYQKGVLELEVDRLKAHLPALHGEKLVTASQELQKKAVLLEKEKGEISRLFQRRRLLFEVRKKCYELALQKEPKKLLILYHILLPALQKELEEAKGKAILKIDRELVFKVLKP
jgi:ATP-dependent Clp protease ATP-binding subunit ClpA